MKRSMLLFILSALSISGTKANSLYRSVGELRKETPILNCLAEDSKSGVRLVLTEKGSAEIRGDVDGFPFSCKLRAVEWRHEILQKKFTVTNLQFVITQCMTLDGLDINPDLFTTTVHFRALKKAREPAETKIYWLNFRPPERCSSYEMDSEALLRRSEKIRKKSSAEF